MQISPVTSIHPSFAAVTAAPAATPPVPADEQVWRSGAPMPTGGVDHPAFLAVRRHGKDLLSFPGVTSLSWNQRDRQVLRMWLANEYVAAIAKRVLEPMIGDVRLELGIESTKQPYTGPADASIGDCVHAIAAMPGVWNYSYQFTRYRGEAIMRTIDAATNARLDPIVRDQLEVAPDPDGTPRFLRISWRAGLPATPPA